MNKAKNILIVLPEKDFNETEFSAVLRHIRNNGHRAFIASDAVGLATGRQGMKVKGDVNFLNIHPSNFDALVIIGGSGIKEYWGNTLLHAAVVKFASLRRIIAAICSAPVVLSRAGILNGLQAVCYPDDRRELERSGTTYIDEPVVIRKNIITARDSKAADAFALTIIEKLT